MNVNKRWMWVNLIKVFYKHLSINSLATRIFCECRLFKFRIIQHKSNKLLSLRSVNAIYMIPRFSVFWNQLMHLHLVVILHSEKLNRSLQWSKNRRSLHQRVSYYSIWDRLTKFQCDCVLLQIEFNIFNPTWKKSHLLARGCFLDNEFLQERVQTEIANNHNIIKFIYNLSQ